MSAMDTRAKALKPLRDLILVGNMMAMKIGQDPNNLANTWDEMVERIRQSGLLQIIDKAELYDATRMNLDAPDWLSERWTAAELKNDMPTWRSLADFLALEMVRLTRNGEPVPNALRWRADEAYQRYLDLHPERVDG